jgi:hypothetical protein
LAEIDQPSCFPGRESESGHGPSLVFIGAAFSKFFILYKEKAADKQRQ